MGLASSKLLYRDIFIRAGSDFIVSAFGLVTMPIIAKSLGVVGYGIYRQIIATCALVMPVLSLRLETASVRYFPAILNNKFELKRQFVSMLVLIWAIMIAFIGVAVVNKSMLSRLVFGTERYMDLIGLVTIFIFFRVSSEFVKNFYRAINKTNYASLFDVLRVFLYVSFLFIALCKMKMGMKGLLLSHILVEVVLITATSLTIFATYLRNIPTCLSYSWLRTYLKYSLPLVAYSVLVWVNDAGDRYLITHMIGLKETGIYSVSYIIAKLPFFLQPAISYVIFPYISQMWFKGETSNIKSFLQKCQTLFLFQAIPITLGLTVLSPYLIRVLAGEEFFMDRTLILLIAIGHIFLGIYQINGYVIDLSQKTVWFLIVLMVTGGVNIGLNLILIPLFGIKGAALATLVAYALQAAILLFLSPRLVSFRIGFDLSFVLKCTLAAIIMAVFVNFLNVGNLMHIILGVLFGSSTYMLIMLIITNKFHDYDFVRGIKCLLSLVQRNK